MEQHGSDALAARDCLEKNGATKIYKEPSGRLHQLCQDQDGNNYDQIIQKNSDGTYDEITAFKPDPNGEGNSWSAIVRWLARKSATAFKGLQ